MEPVWNGMLTCDYEHTRPEGTLLEWDLYTRSLINWPRVLMDDPTPYGRLRRPGIVDIAESDHLRLTRAWHARLADPAGADDLIRRARRNQHRTTNALDDYDTALCRDDLACSKRALAEVTQAFLHVMSTHIVNWLLPEEHWEAFLTELFGNRAQALECLSALMVPAHAGHILAAHTQRQGASDGAAAKSATFITDRRAQAMARRETWETAAILAAAGNDQAVDEVRALARLLGWASDSEERRKELRDRYLAAAHRWCTTTQADPTRITTTDLRGGQRDDYA